MSNIQLTFAPGSFQKFCQAFADERFEEAAKIAQQQREFTVTCLEVGETNRADNITENCIAAALGWEQLRLQAVEMVETVEALKARKNAEASGKEMPVSGRDNGFWR